jgi:hypothetical protein
VFVDPVRVGELRARLHPAFAALAADAPGGERGALAGEGLAWCGAPVGLLEAPAALERGRDLEARLRLALGPQGARVGTIVGTPTVGELEDLVAAQKVQLEAFVAMRGCPAWAAADPAGYGAWAADLYDAEQKLRAELARADRSIAVVPDAVKNYWPDQVDWDAVVSAAHPFVDLMRRYMQAGYCPVPDYRMPQPKNPDVDLGAYKWSDQALRSLKKAADTTWTDYGKPIAIAVGAVAALLIVTRVSK